jgi:aminoglycoside phosphotransferase (APT) family kinase protein
MTNIEDCLPPHLKDATTTIARIEAGLSGAGVYLVEAAGQSFVLKVAAQAENAADWRRAIHIQRLAADAGLAPGIIHVDEPRRAVLTAFVADRSFPSFYRDPLTHQSALTQLGRTVRRVHALPIPADAPRRDPRAFLAQLWAGLSAGTPSAFALPDFARDAINRVLSEPPPTHDRAPVLSHNDLNPTNLVYDGTSILILDWANAGPMDAFFDLSVLAVFLRMDDSTCLRLLSAYAGDDLTALPDHFIYTRRIAASLASTMQLYLARQFKHTGATGEETLASTLPLNEFYQRLQSGALKLRTADGHWAFGLALLKESLTA